MTASFVSPTQRLKEALARGCTLEAAAQRAKVSLAFATVVVEDMQRRGQAASAQSLCASGLGACHGNHDPQVVLHCAGCPLVI